MGSGVQVDRVRRFNLNLRWRYRKEIADAKRWEQKRKRSGR
jgi:hypothetical protein